MKKILISLLLLLSLSGAYAQDNTYREFIEKLEEKNEVIDEESKKLDSYFSTHHKKDIKYYTKVLKKVEIKKAILKNEIDILYYLKFCEEEWLYCPHKLNFSDISIEWNKKDLIKEEIAIRKEKIEELNEDIILKSKVLKSFTEQEEIKLQKQLESRKERNEEYIIKAKREVEKGKYKDALRYYKTACMSFETYECLYWIGDVSFTLWKQYYDKINLYWYESLGIKTFKEAKENLNKALILTSNSTNQKDIELLLKLIDEYPSRKKENKEEPTKKYNLKSKKVETKRVTPLKKSLSKKEKLEKKVNLILKRLDKITAKYSPDKKKKLYTKLITQLEKYKVKTKNSDLKSIIELLVIKLQEY